MDRKGLAVFTAGITGLNQEATKAARTHLDGLSKPTGSLGRLEELAVQLSGITGRVHNHIAKKRLIIFASDNGVAAEGVSLAPASVTLAQTVCIAKGKSGASVLAAYAGAEVVAVDVGIDCKSTPPGVLNYKIARGTGNIAKVPAMTEAQCLQAFETGIALVGAAKADGVSLLGTGEMGIGNTTTAAAVLSALSGLPAAKTAGRGCGLDTAALRHKMTVIDKAIALHRPDPADPVDVLAKVGGFDIAAMCGVVLGAAALRIPVVVDGFIAAVAALCALRLAPAVWYYLIPSHASAEPGHARAMQMLGLIPMLQLDMRLGEGSGCPLAFSLAEAACAVAGNMASFEEAAIDDSFQSNTNADGQLPAEDAV
jgi:nicotinate-nucleotide--dimethylbenzimidazole phosphoribosyltransferase